MSQIFALASPNAPETSEAIADIAARVRQPAALKSALARWRGAQKEYADVTEQLRAAIAAVQAVGGEGATSAGPLTNPVVALQLRERELAGQAQTALLAVLDARQPHARAVAAALAPHRKAAAKSALHAVVALRGALDILDAIDAEIQQSGGTPSRVLPQPGETLRPLTMRLATLAGEIRT